MEIILQQLENIINLFVFILISLAAFLSGNLIFKKIIKNSDKHKIHDFIFDELLVSFALGFGLIGYCTLLLGFLGLLYRVFTYLILCVFLLSFLSFHKSPFFYLIQFKSFVVERYNRSTLLEKILVSFIMCLSLFNLLAALAPPTGQDTLSTYLAIPKIFFAKHSIFYLNENYFSNTPILPSIIYLFGLLLRSGTIGQLIHWLFGVLSAIAIYALTNQYSKTIGLFSSIIFLSLQPVIWESSLALTDLATVFFLLLTFYAFIKWTSSANVRWIIVSGLFAGLAAGSKGYGPIYVAPFAFLILCNTFSTRQRKFKYTLKLEMLFFGSFILVVAVWYIRAYFLTDNPLYPAFFGGKDIASEWFTSHVFHRNNPANSIRDFLLFPIHLTFYYKIYNGWIGPLFLTFIPLIASYKERTDKLILNIFSYCVALFAFICFLGVHFQVRYFLIFFALLAIPVSIIIHKFMNSKGFNVLKLCTLLVVVLWFGFTLSYTIWRKAPTFPVIIGIESEEHYLKHVIPEDADFIDAFNYINKNLPLDAKILYVGSRGYYLDRDYIRFWRLNTGLVNIENILTKEDFIIELEKLDITHILIDWEYPDVKERTNQKNDGLWGFLFSLLDSKEIIEIYRINNCILYKML